MFRTYYSNNYPRRTADIGDTVYMPIRSEKIVIPCKVIGKSIYYGEGSWVEVNTNDYDTTRTIYCETLDVDEPVGYSVELGDDVFETLEEARLYIKPSKKKNLARRLRKYRHATMAFIAGTHHDVFGHCNRPTKARFVAEFKRICPALDLNKKVYVK